jgi:hypothetical protein
MKFIYADSLDFVDPKYDFIADRSPVGREAYWDDLYPHEIMGYAPYDGLLVSRATVGGQQITGKYSQAQALRFRLVGAREFMRYPESKFPNSWVFGDCGAFSYHTMSKPPYSPEEMLEFYEEAGFTHGCSVDHVIFEYDEDKKSMESGTQEAKHRFEITQENAREFLSVSRRLGNRFTPVGVIQGWSPETMATAAKNLARMGYTYLAAGGMANLKTNQIHACLQAIREQVPASVGLHVLGFARADQFHEFSGYAITSFDTTSPLTRAFKDSTRNYYLPGQNGKLRYYSAIRIPQATENNALNRLCKTGRFSQEKLLGLERIALEKIRSYDRKNAGFEETIEAVLEYSEILLIAQEARTGAKPDIELPKLRKRYAVTLQDRPWKECSCAICSEISVEAIIFRSSNRNKRRGIHNLGVFKNHLQPIEGHPAREPEDNLLCN